MAVGRICSRVVVTASPDESVLTVARRMKEQNVGTVVVMSEASKPLAIVTDRDVTLRCVAQEMNAKDTPVSAIMTREVKTVDESAPIEQALRTMAGTGTRRLVVTGELGVLRGVLALDDVIELLTEEAESIGKLLRETSSHVVGAI
jgi:signal-transduction protein with cAMP-binding, CBS, and nucleotidyltransferase domain